QLRHVTTFQVAGQVPIEAPRPPPPAQVVLPCSTSPAEVDSTTPGRTLLATVRAGCRNVVDNGNDRPTLEVVACAHTTSGAAVSCAWVCGSSVARAAHQPPPAATARANKQTRA